jgi:D-alanyl-D-alanine carboxypeptidase (penicillin-binding protein 5/6)
MKKIGEFARKILKGGSRKISEMAATASKDSCFKRRLVQIAVAFVVLLVLLAGVLLFDGYRERLSNPNPAPLNRSEQLALNSALSRTRTLLSPLPYRLVQPDLQIAAESAIVVDAANGSILYEKNADAVISPASLAKLVVMYVIFQEIAAGKMSLDDVVPLPNETWWRNTPDGSSLMFLDEGQTVTLHELLLGLAVSSGNDAAAAVALYSAGSQEAFCAKMNAEMAKLGLVYTLFDHPSGYSDQSTTTAREFAAFAKKYIEVYPAALEIYHSQRSFAYPTAQNYPGRRPPGDTIVQAAKNTALNVIEGSDGLKTGYIPEAGYNLALTVRRDGVRIISVTLGGPGRTTSEGNARRIQDAQIATDWAFASFFTRQFGGFPTEDSVFGQDVTLATSVLGGKTDSVRLVPVNAEALTVPAIIAGETAKQTAERVTATVEYPKALKAPVAAGTQVGALVYRVDDIVLQEVPLIADRTVTQGNMLKRLLDSFFNTWYNQILTSQI